MDMLKQGLVIALGVVALGACQKKSDAPPTPKETAAVSSAQTEHAQAVADKAKADTNVEKAKTAQDTAEQRLDATKDKAKDTASNVKDDEKDRASDRSKSESAWNGPDKSWGKSWADFARGTETTTDKGDYTLERNKDGTITAMRKTQRVSGSSYADMKDSSLAAQVKSRLAADKNDNLKNLQVDAKEHVVTLKGTVKDADEAGDAARIALDTPGTEKVVSHMTWTKK